MAKVYSKKSRRSGIRPFKSSKSKRKFKFRAFGGSKQKTRSSVLRRRRTGNFRKKMYSVLAPKATYQVYSTLLGPANTPDTASFVTALTGQFGGVLAMPVGLTVYPAVDTAEDKTFTTHTGRPFLKTLYVKLDFINLAT